MRLKIKRSGKKIFWGLMIALLVVSGLQLLLKTRQYINGGSPLIITEFVASNRAGLLDEDGEYSDWIEIYNRSSQPLNLSGWTLTDNPNEPDKWAFPDVVLPAHDYLIVFASGKNRRSLENGGLLHTNFRLGQQTSFVALHNILYSRFMDTITPQQPDQYTDVAFGRKADEPTALGYLIFPTPGLKNDDVFVPQELGLSASTSTQSMNATSTVVESPPIPAGQLLITELMYHPVDGDDYEFIELQNVGDTMVNVAGATFEGVKFSFSADTPLVAPGEILVLVRNEQAFAGRYPNIPVAGVYEGQLSNKGETITLFDAHGNVVVSVAYDDEYGWPLTPDGHGDSLVLVKFSGDLNNPLNWRASPTPQGTPGKGALDASGTI